MFSRRAYSAGCPFVVRLQRPEQDIQSDLPVDQLGAEFASETIERIICGNHG
jgi:hypothetical protein